MKKNLIIILIILLILPFILYSQSDEEKIDEYLFKGLKLYEDEKYEKAIAEWKKILTINPKHSKALGYIKQAKYKLKKKKEKQEKQKIDEYLSKGNKLYENKKYEKAIAEWEKILTINPKHPKALSYIQQAKPKLKEKKEKEEKITDSVIIMESPAEAYYKAGIKLVQQAEYEEAIKYFKLALEKDPDFRLAEGEIGNCYEKLGDREKAEESYTKASSLDPKGSKDLVFFSPSHCFSFSYIHPFVSLGGHVEESIQAYNGYGFGAQYLYLTSRNYGIALAAYMIKESYEEEVYSTIYNAKRTFTAFMVRPTARYDIIGPVGVNLGGGIGYGRVSTSLTHPFYYDSSEDGSRGFLVFDALAGLEILPIRQIGLFSNLHILYYTLYFPSIFQLNIDIGLFGQF